VGVNASQVVTHGVPSGRLAIGQIRFTVTRDENWRPIVERRGWEPGQVRTEFLAGSTQGGFSIVKFAETASPVQWDLVDDAEVRLW
jgi:hypothetical protein